MKRIQQYESAKSKIENIYIQDMLNFQMEKLLCEKLWKMYGFSILQKWTRTIALLACNTLHLSEYSDSVQERDMALEIHWRGVSPRQDQLTIFHNLYDYLKPSKHILLEQKYHFQIKGFIKRFIRFFKYSRAITGFSLSNRTYLAAQLVMVKGLSDYLNEIGFFNKCRYLLIFQESDVISSAIIQIAHQYGVKVLSPQHGMPLNRHENFDQLFFDACQCDYKLLWNDFSKKQYLSAAIPAERLFVVGNTKMLNVFDTSRTRITTVKADTSSEKTIQIDSLSYFGVLLNCPDNDGAYEANCKLLSAAAILSKTLKIKYYIKLHPRDSIYRYKKYIPSLLAEVLPADTSMMEYEGKVLFSIAHATAAIFDLIYDGCFIFQYIMGELFPVDMEDIYKFSDPAELVRNFITWKDNYNFYRKSYTYTISKYHVLNAKERHDLFFKQLLADELNQYTGCENK